MFEDCTDDPVDSALVLKDARDSLVEAVGEVTALEPDPVIQLV